MVAAFLLGFLGMAAVLVDLGLSRITQASMQTAADSAALEGLRWRDMGAPTTGDCGAEDLDCRRRAHVSRFVPDQMFAPSGAGDTARLGAGPVVSLSGGSGGELNAFQTLDPGRSSTYVPTLERNAGDAPAGDQVAGRYVADASHAEGNDYARPDFTPGGSSPPSFLVRLRRSREEAVPGVVSSGPTLPFLFGRPGVARVEGEGYNPRVDGITVRATAIADARCAQSVGARVLAPPLVGHTGFAIDLGAWNALPEPTDGAPVPPPAAVPDDRFRPIQRAEANGLETPIGGRASQLGDPTGASGSSIPDTERPVAVFLPIFAADLGSRIVGFGHAEISPREDPGRPVRRLRAVAPSNASVRRVSATDPASLAFAGSLALDAQGCACIVDPGDPTDPCVRLVSGSLLAPALVR